MMRRPMRTATFFFASKFQRWPWPSYLVCHKRNFYISFSANHDRQSVTVETPIKNGFLFIFRFPSCCPSMPYNACDIFQLRYAHEKMKHVKFWQIIPHPIRIVIIIICSTNRNANVIRSFPSKNVQRTFTQSQSLSLRRSSPSVCLNLNNDKKFLSFWRFLCQHPSISYFRWIEN